MISIDEIYEKYFKGKDPSSITSKEVNKIYKDFLKENHPDFHPGTEEEYQKESVEIQMGLEEIRTAVKEGNLEKLLGKTKKQSATSQSYQQQTETPEEHRKKQEKAYQDIVRNARKQRQERKHHEEAKQKSGQTNNQNDSPFWFYPRNDGKAVFVQSLETLKYEGRDLSKYRIIIDEKQYMVYTDATINLNLNNLDEKTRNDVLNRFLPENRLNYYTKNYGGYIGNYTLEDVTAKDPETGETTKGKYVYVNDIDYDKKFGERFKNRESQQAQSQPIYRYSSANGRQIDIKPIGKLNYKQHDLIKYSIEIRQPKASGSQTLVAKQYTIYADSTASLNLDNLEGKNRNDVLNRFLSDKRIEECVEQYGGYIGNYSIQDVTSTDPETAKTTTRKYVYVNDFEYDKHFGKEFNEREVLKEMNKNKADFPTMDGSVFGIYTVGHKYENGVQKPRYKLYDSKNDRCQLIEDIDLDYLRQCKEKGNYDEKYFRIIVGLQKNMKNYYTTRDIRQAQEGVSSEAEKRTYQTMHSNIYGKETQEEKFQEEYK